MAEIKERPAVIDASTPVVDVDIAPAHRAWMDDQIEQALEHKRSGRATYKSLEDTRRKFGF